MIEPDEIARFQQHDRWTDPGPHVAELRRLPATPSAAVETTQGLIAHADYPGVHGLAPEDVPPDARRTRPASERFDRVLARSDDPLCRPRPPERRELGTCRDYALMLCAILREFGMAARVRCGFAVYLAEGRYEDHWVTEYRVPRMRRWDVADAQLDDAMRAHLGIDINPEKLDDGRFIDARRAWTGYSLGRLDGAMFGHGTAIGPHMIVVNLARDRLALQGELASDWDGWRDSLPWPDALPDDLLEMGNRIAAGSGDVPEPFWL